MVLGVDYEAGNAYIRSKYATRYNNSGLSSSSSNNMQLQQQQGDTFASTVLGDVGSGNTCTDGKDDGKIGLLSAIGNIGQGIVRGATNMVKGMFTDENGNFSPLKTLGTVAMGAACIAFPPLGLATCAVGAVTGGAKVISNVGKAMSADTDAEAKAAWEEVGSGGLQTGLSIAGAKASYGAMKNTSTANALTHLEEKAASGESVTLKDYGKAFIEDAKSSAKNNGKNLWESAKTRAESGIKEAKLSRKAKEYNNLKTRTDLSEAEQARFTELEGDTEVITKASELETKAQAKAASKAKVRSAKEEMSETKNAYKKANKSIDKAIADIEKKLENASDVEKPKLETELSKLKSIKEDVGKEYTGVKTNYDSTMSEHTFGGRVKSAIKAKSSKITNSLKENKFDVKGLKPGNLKDGAIKLGKNGKEAISNFMKNDSPDFIEPYGYKTNGQVVSVLSGERITDEGI